MNLEPFPYSKDEIVEIQKIGMEALKEAGRVHDALGERGKERIQNNQFGQNSLRADIECEETIFRVCERSGLSVFFKSEEHGDYTIGKDPKILGVVDGIDGTNRYVAGLDRWGTTFGLYAGLDPKYSDYLFGGILIHPAKQLYYAGRDLGAFEMNKDGISTPIKTSKVSDLTPNKTRLYADTLYDEEYGLDLITSKLKKNFSDFDIKCLRSACVHLADLVSGKVDAVIETTRKGNLEIGAAFAIINEAGGVILDINRRNLSNEKYLSFGQTEDITIVDAANLQLARKIITRMSK